jgi:hypothetical protein
MIRVIGDVLKAFSVELDMSTEEWDDLSEDQKKEKIADQLGLRRFGREEDVRIDDAGSEE